MFQRYELKYLITHEQRERILDAAAPYMKSDQFGRSTVRSLYYDTETFRLVRRSLDSPVYKEKLRLRSYCQTEPESTVFVELKKKYRSVVYKRRLPLDCAAAEAWLSGGEKPGTGAQIEEEIEYFRSYYTGLRPAILISCDREAFFAADGSDLRLTFDERILADDQATSLCTRPKGWELLEDGKVLMEIKTSGGIPLWLTALLSLIHI